MRAFILASYSFKRTSLVMIVIIFIFQHSTSASANTIKTGKVGAVMCMLML